MRLKGFYVLAALAVGAVASAAAWAECTLPPAPSKVPDASTATQEEMMSAMKTLKQYNTDVLNYTKCLEFEAKQSRLPFREQERLHNQAIDTLKAVADKF